MVKPVVVIPPGAAQIAFGDEVLAETVTAGATLNRLEGKVTASVTVVPAVGTATVAIPAAPPS